ncbi:hypothetical protein thsrh120_33140 [Rhizobium sp. No.120]
MNDKKIHSEFLNFSRKSTNKRVLEFSYDLKQVKQRDEIQTIVPGLYSSHDAMFQ